jgi:hypothetical protein
MSPQSSPDLIEMLGSSSREFVLALDGLSDAAASAKPAENCWSVIDCVEHICITEGLGLKRLQSAEAAEPQVDSAREQFLASQVVQRENKIPGPPITMPTGRFATLVEALSEFVAARGRTIAFVSCCPNLSSLRLTHPVFGPLNGREYVVLIAGHARRHAAQIADIRAQMA